MLKRLRHLFGLDWKLMGATKCDVIYTTFLNSEPQHRTIVYYLYERNDERKVKIHVPSELESKGYEYESPTYLKVVIPWLSYPKELKPLKAEIIK